MRLLPDPEPHRCMEGYWPVPCDERCPERIRRDRDPAAARALVEQALRKEAS